jgi:peptidoglycan-associated lipoprotein
MKNIIGATLVATVGAVVIGCGGASTALDSGEGVRSAARVPTQIQLAENEDMQCDIATVFFHYDSDRLNARSRQALQGAAECIAHGEELPIHLTGAADPRGTEEYNLALGERRARSARDYMVALGVDPSLVSFSSVGEELSRGSNEATWALDRHVASARHERGDTLAAPRASLVR